MKISYSVHISLKLGIEKNVYNQIVIIITHYSKCNDGPCKMHITDKII